MSTIKKNWMKHLLQWGVLLAIIVFLTKLFGNKTADPEAYCPFGGLETLATYLTRGSLACSMTMVQIMMGVVLTCGVILFGKLFCGYICPMGLINELFFKLRKKLKIKFIRIANGSVADKILRVVKYLLLFTVFYMTLSSSELFCKNFDPYYAFATGFKGEITVWMAIISISVLILGSLLVDMFWCKYICPLGALSNLFKFTIWFVGLILFYAILILLGVNVSWLYLLIAACVMGYLLEILCGNPKIFPFMHVNRNEEKCNNCGVCAKKCPYHIDVDKLQKVKCVDCTLCGECVASCKKEALTITKCKSGKYLPAIIVVLLFAIGLYLGNKIELPTIDVEWNTEKVEGVKLETFEMSGLTSVKCYGSSMAFKAKLENVTGVYGVKTFVKNNKALIKYNPSQTDEETIQKSIYTPSKFRINSPANGVTKVKVITIRTENMFDKMNVNYLGMQFRNTGKKYYGLETEFACPLIVRIYMDVDEPVDETFLKSVVEADVLEMPVHGGDFKKIKCNYKFVKLEDGEEFVEMRPYLEKMFNGFATEFQQRVDQYAGQNQEIYEIANENYEKPIIIRQMPFLSNHLSTHNGIIGVYLVLNANNLPAIQIKYATADMNPDKLWELITMPVWTITYKEGDVREEGAKIKFEEKGVVIPVK